MKLKARRTLACFVSLCIMVTMFTGIPLVVHADDPPTIVDAKSDGDHKIILEFSDNVYIEGSPDPTQADQQTLRTYLRSIFSVSGTEDGSGTTAVTNITTDPTDSKNIILTVDDLSNTEELDESGNVTGYDTLVKYNTDHMDTDKDLCIWGANNPVDNFNIQFTLLPTQLTVTADKTGITTPGKSKIGASAKSGGTLKYSLSQVDYIEPINNTDETEFSGRNIQLLPGDGVISVTVGYYIDIYEVLNGKIVGFGSHKVTASEIASDQSTASASLNESGSKSAGDSFGVNIQNAKDASGSFITGATSVSATDSLQGGVYTGSPDLSSTGSATVVIPAGEMTTPGTHTLTFTIAGVTDSPTLGVTITTGPAASMIIDQQAIAPSENGGQFAQQPVLRLYDRYGSFCSNDSSTVVTAARGDSGSWTLTGTKTAQAVNGVVTFSDLGASSSSAVNGAQITFTAAGLTGATSSAVTIPGPTDAAAPVITNQPSDMNVVTGGTAVLTTTASGVSLSYQWYSNTANNSSGGTIIGGATGNTYSAPTGTEGTTYYYCVVTNTDITATGSKTATATSSAAKVTVTATTTVPTDAAAPVITGQPSDISISAGGTAVLTTTASGVSLSYQWYSNTANSSSGGTIIVGATGRSYSAPTGTAGTTYYYCVVKNTDNTAAGSKTATTRSSAAKVTVTPTWQFSANDASSTHIAVDKFGTPYVAYTDSAAVVKKFNGSGWVPVGSLSSKETGELSIMIDNNGTPYVAYRVNSYDSSHYKAGMKKFDGSNWVTVGSGYISAGQADYISMAIDKNNTPYVAYSDKGADNTWKAIVKKYDGSNWVTVGSGYISTGQAVSISIAIDKNNTPYVAYSDWADFTKKVTVKKFDGSTWVTVGSGSISTGQTSYVCVAVDKNNTPYVAYDEFDSGNITYKAVMKKYDAHYGWIKVGSDFSENEVSNISIAVDGNGTPYAVYEENSDTTYVVVRKYDGSNWVTVGSSNYLASHVNGAAIAVDKYNSLYAIYSEDVDNDSNEEYEKVNVMKYTSVTAGQVDASAPGITEEPFDVNVDIGGTAVLTTTANGVSLSYQWYSNTTNGNSGGSLIGGATSSSYSAPTETAGTIYYYCVVTNTENDATGSKTASTSSRAAKVTVNQLQTNDNSVKAGGGGGGGGGEDSKNPQPDTTLPTPEKINETINKLADTASSIASETDPVKA